jgi:hypothetical protein
LSLAVTISRFVAHLKVRRATAPAPQPRRSIHRAAVLTPPDGFPHLDREVDEFHEVVTYRGTGIVGLHCHCLLSNLSNLSSLFRPTRSIGRFFFFLSL